MSETIPVYDGPGTTTFGIFGTSPESPDGKRICYVRYLSVPDDEKWKKLGIESELWVCDHNLSQHNKLADLVVKPLHNGAHAFWIDDRRIAYSTRRNIYVVDADSGTQLLGPIQGEVGHDAHDGKLLFWESGDNVHGAYELDVDTGKMHLVISEDAVRQCVEDGLKMEIGDFSGKHLAYSTGGSRIGLRLGGIVDDMVTLSRDCSQVRLYPRPKPVHQLWYDDDTIMGVWGRNAPEGTGRHYYRWTIDGEPLEELAGPMSHADASPDRQWFAGEACPYYQKPIEMALYRRGENVRTATFFKHSFDYVTWGLRFHVNPAFSRDGKRLYFSEAVAEDKVEARFADLTSYID
ncbi:MAG: hypothetical protein QGG64_12865 [Candidatus Latescibacteria bacterium]|jgi:hypothetical protein|nr:hypothetical protein [Candidatus Latescibacterota bacterium]